MEELVILIHTNADEAGIRAIINYPIKGNEVLKKGYGVTPYNTDDAVMQMMSTASYWGNLGKSPICHAVLSFTEVTAPTPEKALELAEIIFGIYLSTHLMLIGIHEERHGPSLYHAHVVYSPTNFVNGSMIKSGNRGVFPLAKNVADVTRRMCRLVIKPEDKSKKEYHLCFYPHGFLKAK